MISFIASADEICFVAKYDDLNISSLNTEIQEGRVEILPLDKYGVNTRAVYQPRSRKPGSEYVRLIEDGKEWRCNAIFKTGIMFPDYDPDRSIDNLYVWKLDGTENIEGKEYFRLNIYKTEGMVNQLNQPLAFLREEPETGQVYVRLNLDVFYDFSVGHITEWIFDYISDDQLPESGYSEEMLLYDFDTFGHGKATYNLEPGEIIEIEGVDRNFKARKFNCRNRANLAIAEGLGMVNLTEPYKNDLDATILGAGKDEACSWPITSVIATLMKLQTVQGM